MKKVWQNIFLSAALLASTAFAFTNGSAPGTQPWNIPVPGGLYAGYEYGTGQSNTKIQDTAQMEVITLEIQQLTVSTHTVPKGGTATVTFAVKNTSGTAVSNITATPVFYQTANTGNAETDANSYTVSAISAPTSIAANGTAIYYFTVMPGATRKLGRLWVDGRVSFIANSATETDSWWRNTNIESNRWFTGAKSVDYLDSDTATLNLSAIEIVSPNGAIDRTISAGQEFWVSFNIQKIGDSDLGGTFTATVNWNGVDKAVAYTIGTPLTVTLNAGATIGNNLPLTVTIGNAGITDLTWGGAVGISGSPQILGINVVAPAQLTIQSLKIPTDNVEAFQSGPVPATVTVYNPGGADAIFDGNFSALKFEVNGTDWTYTYNVPKLADVNIPAGGTYNLPFVINTFGGGAGVCTVSATIIYTDENVGAQLVTSSVLTDLNQIATYNVTYNASIYVSEMYVTPNPFKKVDATAPAQLVVKMEGLNPGRTISVGQIMPNDIIIIGPDGNNGAWSSFNVTVESPQPPYGEIVGTGTLIITYNINPLDDAIPGEHTFMLATDAPSASFKDTGVKAYIGGNTSTTANYDPISPNLILATSNVYQVIAPTDNFYLELEFDKEMNTGTMPSLNFEMNGAWPGFTTGNWLNGYGATLNNLFAVTMSLITENSGYVTVHLTEGTALDTVGNANAVSQNILIFFVDSEPPSGSIIINAGETITSNQAVTLTISALTDNYSAAVSMSFMIVSPDSQISANQNVSLNTWLPYAPDTLVYLNTDTLGTKNIYVRFRDEAGNESEIVSASIVFDTDDVVWIYPQSNYVISGNVELQIRSSLQTAAVNFFVSINNVLTPLTVSNLQYNPQTSTTNAIWNSGAYTTRDAQLIAVVEKNDSTVNTGDVYAVIIDNVAPSVNIVMPALNPAGNAAYVNGSTYIEGTATDNQLATEIAKIVLTISLNGTILETQELTTTLENWSFFWEVPSADPVNTTYNAVVTAYDLAGNSSNHNILLVKTDATPNIIVTSPSPNLWLDNTFEFTGTASSLLPLKEIRASLFRAVDGQIMVNNLLAIGTANWTVTFDLTAQELIDITQFYNPVTLSMTAITDTVPPVTATHDFVYRIDGIVPVTISVPVGTIPAVGTLNITGNVRDLHSGVSAIGIIMEYLGGTIVTENVLTVNNPGTAPVDFTFPVPVSEDVIVTLLFSDNAYPSPNVLTHTFDIVYDASLLPRGSATPNALSGYYVNNLMRISGWAAVSPNLAEVEAVSVNFYSPVTGTDSGWLRADVLGNIGNTANWNVDWQVPSPNRPDELGPDPHGTTYNVSLLVKSSAGIEALVTTNVNFEKDIYGANASFMNLADGIFLNPEDSPMLIESLTRTEGAPISTANVYLVINGVRQDNPKFGTDNRVTGNGNQSFNLLWDYVTYAGDRQVLSIRTIDAVGNETESPTITVRTVPDVIITDPLPSSANGAVDVFELYRPIYATSLNYVTFTNLNPNDDPAVTLEAVITVVRGIGVHRMVPNSTGITGEYTVSLNNNEPIIDTDEIVYMITIVESDGQSVTLHQQPIMHDHTPPTVNIVFDGVTRYYPGAVISPKEEFTIQIQDRTSADFNVRGSGFSVNAGGRFDVVSGSITPTPSFDEQISGLIRRSILQNNTSVNASIADGSSGFDPLSEMLRFRGALSQGTYQLSLDAIDNAGNAMITTFNVMNLIVNSNASGESGTLDMSKFITAYPNPYDPRKGDVLFTYFLKDAAQKSRIMVYNQIGELVHLITIEGAGQEGTRAGYNQVAWDGLDKFSHDISNGVYIYMIVVDGDAGQTFAKGTMAVIKE